MRLFTSLFAFVILAAVVVAVDINGYWTDSRYGGNFPICATNVSANGLYTEYGLAVGSFDGKTWEGSWYQGGVGDCLSGGMKLTFNTNSFSGKYWCNTDPDTQFDWSGDKENNTTPTNFECGAVAESTSGRGMGGLWVNTIATNDVDRVDFCQYEDKTFQASYTQGHSQTPLGYDAGYWANGMTISYGSAYRTNQYDDYDGVLPGTSLWFINADGDLANIWWAGHFKALNLRQMNNTQIHTYNVYKFVEGTTENECSRYSNLAELDYDYYPFKFIIYYFYYFEYQYPSTASASTVMLSALAAMLAVFIAW